MKDEEIQQLQQLHQQCQARIEQVVAALQQSVEQKDAELQVKDAELQAKDELLEEKDTTTAVGSVGERGKFCGHRSFETGVEGWTASSFSN